MTRPNVHATASPADLAHAELRGEAYFNYLLAQQYLNDKQIDKAIEAYNNALKVDPQSPMLLTELAALYLRQGNLDSALKLTEQVHPATIRNTLPHTCFSGSFMPGRAGWPRQSMPTRRSLKWSPSDEDAYLLLGTLYAQEKVTLDEAVQVFDQLKAIVPDNPLSLYYKARIFLDIEIYDQAEHLYRELLLAEPEFENGLLDLAYIYEVTDRPREAEKTYLKILFGNPASVLAGTGWATSTCVKTGQMRPFRHSTSCSS